VRWPGVIRDPFTTAQAAISMDLTATILAAAGARAPAGRKLDGIDLRPILSGARQPFQRTLFWRYKRLENRRWAVLDGDTKYVRDGETESLHDLAADESERNNLLPQESGKAARLRGLLNDWEREVAAPRLRGFRPPDTR